MTDTMIASSNKKPWAIVGGVLVLFFSMTALTGCSSDTTAQNSQTPAKAAVVFDLEALHGKNITDIRSALGNPTDASADPTPEQVKLDPEWNNTFSKDGYDLLVTYDSSTGKVKDFFVGTTDPYGATKDVDGLKDVLNVRDSSNYTIKPVPTMQDKSLYTGIIVTPKQ
jgi:hypothetical protein